MMVQFNSELNVEEVSGLSSEMPGMWVVVRRGRVEGKETRTVVGVVGVADDADQQKVLMYVSECLTRAKDKYGTDIRLLCVSQQRSK